MLFLSSAIVLLSTAGAVLPLSRATAASGILVAPVVVAKGFGILDTGKVKGSYNFDQATSTAANWSIVAWSNPPGKSYFQPFTKTTSGDTQIWETLSSSAAKQSMALALEMTPTTGVAAETLLQKGFTSTSGCSTAQGNPLENDFFVSGNARSTNPHYPSAYLRDGAKPPANPPLSQVTAIDIQGTVQLLESEAVVATGPCLVDQSGMLYALIFQDTVKGQWLYYQLDLNAFCFPGTNAARNAWCRTYKPSMTYFATGTNSTWGIDDVITNYTSSKTKTAFSLLRSPGAIALDLNFLPRIASLITKGQYGLDKTLADWTWNGFYYGQHTWGSATLQSSWTSTNFSPTIQYTPAP
jgi:hypothetical protein